MRHAVFLLILLCLAGCGGGSPAAGGSGSGPGQATAGTNPGGSGHVGGKTGVELAVSVKRAKEVRAATAEDVQEVLIDFLDPVTLQPVVPTTIVRRSAPSVDVTVEVPVGTWILRCQGRTAAGEVAGTRFETTITVVEGQTTQAVAELDPAVNLSSIQLSPGPTALMAQGTTQQFTATGVLSDLTTQDLTGLATWASGNPAVATVSATGLVTAVSHGTTVISAQRGSLTGSTVLTVSPTGLRTLQITPNPLDLTTGLTQQLTATGVFQDSTNQDLTAQATWTSANPAVATVNATGLVTATGPGQTTITGRVGNVTGTTNVTVAPTLLRIVLSPANLTLPVGSTQTIQATGIFSNNATEVVNVTWTSASPAVATVSDTGLVTGVAAGNTQITARAANVTATANVTVEPVLLTRLTVAPSTATIPKGSGQAFNATGTFSNNSTRDLTEEVTWTSVNASVASISNANGTRGQATGVNVGATAIEATLDGISGAATVNVTPATLISITLTPANPEALSGDLVLFRAVGSFSDGTSLVITANVTWTSANVSVVVVSNAAGTEGQATSTANGTTTVTAALGNVTASTSFTTRVPLPPPVVPSPSPAAVGNILVSHPPGTPTVGATGVSFVGGPRCTSADGRYVVFRSDASNLDAVGLPGAFRYDTQTRTVLRVSGPIPNGSPSYGPEVAISADGNRVAFSTNQDLVPEDTNFGLGDASFLNSDVYVYDVALDQFILVSRTGAVARGRARVPALAGNGLVAAFMDVRGGIFPDVYRATLGSDAVDVGGLDGDPFGGAAFEPTLNHDGSLLAFTSNRDYSGGLPPTPPVTPNAFGTACWLYNGTTYTLISRGAVGPPDASTANLGCLSPDGTHFSYISNVNPDTGAFGPSRVWAGPILNPSQVSTSTVILASTSISEGGRYVTWTSNFDQPPNPGTPWGISRTEAWVRDLLTGNIGRVTYSANGNSAAPSISADGSRIVFRSIATDLIPGLTVTTDNVYQVANPVFNGATAPPPPPGSATGTTGGAT